MKNLIILFLVMINQQIVGYLGSIDSNFYQEAKLLETDYSLAYRHIPQQENHGGPRGAEKEERLPR